MQVGVTLLKQVGDMSRLCKENVLSNSSILVFSAVMLKSPSNTMFPNSLSVSKTRKQTFYKSTFTVTRMLIKLVTSTHHGELKQGMIFQNPLFIT